MLRLRLLIPVLIVLCGCSSPTLLREDYRIEYYINEEMNNETLQAVTHCFSRWEEQSPFRFHFAGKTKAGLIRDGKNTVSIANTMPRGLEHKIGYTYCWHTGGVIYESDILINAAISRLTTQHLNEKNCYYLETILMHEIGHALGLEHDDHAESVMFHEIGVGLLKDHIDTYTRKALDEKYAGGRK